MMDCTKCHRKIAVRHLRCMYCGTAAPGAVVTRHHKITDSNNGFSVESDEWVEVDLSRLPDDQRRAYAAAVSNGPAEVSTCSETRTVEHHPAGTSFGLDCVSEEDALTMLAGCQKQFDAGHIEYDEFEPMVVKIIQQYVAGMDNLVAIRWLDDGYRQTRFKAFVNSEILKKITAGILT